MAEVMIPFSMVRRWFNELEATLEPLARASDTISGSISLLSQAFIDRRDMKDMTGMMVAVATQNIELTMLHQSVLHARFDMLAKMISILEVGCAIHAASQEGLNGALSASPHPVLCLET